ncbi:unnamed protein product [Chrysoparadoxa australica]
MEPAPHPGVAELTRQLDQERIDQLTLRLEELREENETLKSKIFKTEKDTHEFVAYFQREMENKDMAVTQLSQELLTKTTDFRVQLKEMQEKQTREMEDLKSEMHSNEKQLKSQILLLEGELAGLETVREARDTHRKTLDDLTARLKKAEETNASDLLVLERKFLTEKRQMQKEAEAEAENVQRQAVQAARSSLAGETQRIMADNTRMAEELRFQLQVTDELQAEKKKLEAEGVELRREVNLLAARDGEHAKRGHAKNKEMRRLRQQVDELSKAIELEARKGREERDGERAAVAHELEEQTLDAAGLRQLLALKNKELRHIKRLSQYILSQRTELESFFIGALQQVKDHVVQERERRYRASVSEYNAQIREATKKGASSQFPRIRRLRDMDAQLPSVLPVQPPSKVHLQDLSWEDKERVLKLLFAKLNGVPGINGGVEPLPETFQLSRGVEEEPERLLV